jgi:hypothetical protein
MGQRDILQLSKNGGRLTCPRFPIADKLFHIISYMAVLEDMMHILYPDEYEEDGMNICQSKIDLC